MTNTTPAAPGPRGLHMLLYGPPGGGKTTLASQLPRPAQFVDQEGGVGWLKGDQAGLTVVPIRETEDPLARVTACLVDSARTGRYLSTTIDSLPALREACLRHRAGPNNPPSQQDYGAFYWWLSNTLATTQFMPNIILWIAPYEEIQTVGRTVLRPGGLSENNLLQVNQYLDAIIYMGFRQKPGGTLTRYLTVEPTEPFGGRSSIMTKDRTGLLPGTLELPGLTKDGQVPDMIGPYFGAALTRLFGAPGAARPRK